MSEATARHIIRAGVVCKATSLAARGAGWERIGELMSPKLPDGMTVEDLRAAVLAHLELERPQ